MKTALVWWLMCPLILCVAEEYVPYRVITNAWKLLLVNCYMPYEDDDAKFDDFVSELSVIEDLVNAHNDCRVMTCGYFNVDFSRTGLHTVLLKSFCETLNVASLSHKCQPASPLLDNI